MVALRTPVPVAGAQRRIGEQVATWRRLRQLTAAQVADRAGISRSTVMRLESGEGATLENLLRVAQALGVLNPLAAALDPFATGLGGFASSARPGRAARAARPARADSHERQPVAVLQPLARRR